MATIIKDLGIHEVIEYRTNEKGEKIKIIKTVKRFSIPVKKYESVTERQNTWVKFGKAACDGNDKVTFRSTEDVFMEPPSPPGGKIKKNNDDSMMKCRHCHADHWTRLCPSLDENKEIPTAAISESKRESKTNNSSDSKTYNNNKDLKGKDGNKPAYEKKVYTEGCKTTKTILIQNLSKDIKEYDIHELLNSTGCHIYKIFIPKDYQSGDSRGMAFVDVKNIQEANSIISKYDNFGIKYLPVILIIKSELVIIFEFFIE